MGRGARLLFLAVWPALLLAGCSARSAAGQPGIVLAAASLTAPFQALAEAFARQHPRTQLELHFAGTPRLVVQIREGAPADVFASADRESMQRVVEAGHAASPPSIFATNRLAIVTAKGNPHAIGGLADLARPELTIVLCGPEVPAGRYARAALAKASVLVRPASDEPSVKAVLSKVRLGEADAGIVYVTDAASAPADVDAVRIPDELDVVAHYPIAVLSTGRCREGGEAFAAFVLSPAGQEILRSFGFGTP